ncbi:protein kinase domain-containing protein [Haliangium ochraceum]|uniref:Serine/threonine protein kinase n=1 Tax=Haliangium ochraceum (strain DSM 14365 / JCM 11303 / SMP-2) TaxID=502025 RepID=D0LM73_HALO1|nr:protein kinase [Haliangium ochraceum]ACY16779.1 serine/threonine protein kinase [Haliangium ochraceum DSM 14365]
MQPGDVIAERYELISLAGEGGMGRVFHAWDQGLERSVAIKLLHQHRRDDEGEAQRFLAEARAAAGLRTPHVAAVHDFGYHRDQPYLVLGYIDGPSLSELLRAGPLAPVRTARLLLHACEALSQVHALGLVHCDVKPDNFRIAHGPGQQEQLVLLDFGIARAVAADRDSAEAGDMAVVGAPAYMAPEQMADSSLADARSDLYSLGVVAYQLLTGELPFAAGNTMELLLAVRDRQPTSLQERGAMISDEFEATVLRCLEKDPDARFASADELRQALRSIPDFAWCFPSEPDPPLPVSVEDEAASIVLSAYPWASATKSRRRSIELPPLLAHEERMSAAAAELPTGAILVGSRSPFQVLAEGSGKPRSRSERSGEDLLPQAPNSSPSVELSRSPSLLPSGFWGGAAASSTTTSLSFGSRTRGQTPDEALQQRLSVEPSGRRRRRAWRAVRDAVSALFALLVRALRRQRAQRATPLLTSAAATTVRAAAATAAGGERDLVSAYAKAAGFAVTSDDGELVELRPGSGQALPAGRYLALRMYADANAVAMQTLATAAFQRDAQRLYRLAGTPSEPCWVLLVDARPPGVGIYREQHTLVRERHLRMLSVRPQAMQAAVRSGGVPAHFAALLAQTRDDPFAFEGPIEDELEFFGSGEHIRALLDDVRMRKGSVGVFGLDKWGTTSLLRRLRAELLADGGHAVVWIDCRLAPRLDDAWLRQTLLACLSEATGARRPRRGAATLEQVLAMARRCAEQYQGRPPVLLFDRADEILAPARAEAGAIAAAADLLRRLADHEAPVVLVLGGVQDGVVTARRLQVRGGDLPNPLWRALQARYAPLFTREETDEFLRRMCSRAGFEMHPGALARVHALTGGHKYLCRLLGSAVCARVRRIARPGEPVAEALVLEAARMVIVHHDDYFAALLERAPLAARLLLVRLSAGVLSHDDIFGRADEISDTAREVRDGFGALPVAERREVVGFLLRHGLVEEREGAYALVIELFARWLYAHSGAARRVPFDFGGPGASPDGGRASAAAPGAAVISPGAAPRANGNQMPPAQGRDHQRRELARLRVLLSERFTAGELELLLATLGVALEEVTSRASPLPKQAHDVVGWFERRSRLPELRDAVRKVRPGEFAPSAPAAGTADHAPPAAE